MGTRIGGVAPLALFGALLASACVMESDEVESGVDAAQAARHLAASEPDAAAYKQCGKHYACCQDTMLGDVYDEPNRSRCQTCVRRCNDKVDGRGHWPDFTHAGWDCRYWRQEFWYRRPSRECEGLRQ